MMMCHVLDLMSRSMGSEVFRPAYVLLLPTTDNREEAMMSARYTLVFAEMVCSFL